MSEDVTLHCADGQALAGQFFAAPEAPQRLPVLLSPATGVPQAFYRRFCLWLAAQGHAVLVFDYRGIGRSLQGDVRHSPARLQDWGALDQAAAIDWLRQRCGVPRVLLLGHSAGGQLMGLLPDREALAGVVAVAGSTGWLGGMPWRFRPVAWWFLKCWLPLSVRWSGAGRCKAVGQGEDLPRGVALQWAAWCSRPGYAVNAPGGEAVRQGHEALRCSLTVLHASDDPIATAANVEDLLRRFPNARRRSEQLRPQDFGYAQLGHIDLFRASRERVWPRIAQALQAAA